MEDEGNRTRPLTSKELTSLKALEEVEELEYPLALTLSTFRLPKGVKASVVQAEGIEDIHHLQVELKLGEIGQLMPYETIRVETLDEKKLKRKGAQISPQGMRPKFLPVKFLPRRVKLELSQRAMPPFDFDYKREGKLVDRPTSIFAPDQRYIYQDTSFPWCTVGRIDTPLGSGTGCTIGSRLLLTCNHAIQWNSDGTAGYVRFRPAYYNGSAPFGEAWATSVIHWIRTVPANGLSNQETAFDYVVCVLDRRIGDIVGYPGYRIYDDDWNGGSYWQHMGYPGDLSGGQRPAFQGACVISSVEGESTSGQRGYVLGHFNDVVGGHSGGPVWGWWSNEPWPRVVGTQSAEANTPSNNTSGDNEFGGGPALSSLISWARSHYP